MRTSTFIVALGVVALIVGCTDGRRRATASPDQTAAATTAPSNEPAILIFDRDLGIALPTTSPAPEPPPPLEAAVWADGRIVWRAGNALLQGHVDAKQVTELLERLDRDGAFGGNGKPRHRHFGPDASYEVIDVRVGEKSLRMESWHEGFEQNTKLVATAHGIEPLNGRDRAAVLAEQPAEYRAFRALWSDVRETVRSWTPAQGEAFTGNVPLRHGD